ncbi:MAG: BON domain-containing protein [Deltaproteobacteria bacterium]|nr:BON domain-containing protein [Deltaproteobacteria bacterium]
MKKYMGFIMIPVIIITGGCTVALIGGAASGGYAVATDERKTGRMMDDSTITTRINNAMIKDHVVKAHQIDVDTVGGHVTLTGFVKTPEEAQRAVQIATREAGIKSVRNNLQIGENQKGLLLMSQRFKIYQ